MNSGVRQRFACMFSTTVRDLGKFLEKYEEFEPENVARPCWQTESKPNKGYLVYRWCQLIFHFAFMMMSVCEIGRWYHPDYKVAFSTPKNSMYYLKWLLYLTHWGLVLNVMQAVIGVCLVYKVNQFMNRINAANNGIPTQYYYPTGLASAFLKMFAIALHLSTYITVGFWLMVYEPVTCEVDLVTISEHGLGTALLLIDLFVTSIPYKLVYGLYTVGVSAAYLALTYVHYLFNALDRFNDKPYIYEKSHWDFPKTVLLYYIISVFIMVSFHLSIWGLYLLRRYLALMAHGQVRTG